jgi:8-oxo-dGTP pyrophosphatase MutT (NUDIX family)
LAITADEQAIMIKQYRHPIEASIFELPGGFIEDKEDPAIGIARELQEETGFVFSNIYPVGKIAANPGVLNNFTYLFLTEYFDAYKVARIIDSSYYLWADGIYFYKTLRSGQ